MPGPLSWPGGTRTVQAIMENAKSKVRKSGKTRANRNKPRNTTRDAGGNHKRGSQNRNKNGRGLTR